jgi:Flp pilus assembly protein TadD
MSWPLNARKTVARALASTLVAAALAGALGAAPGVALAKETKAQAKQIANDQIVADVQQAIDEKRYLDAGSMIDTAVLGGSRDPRLALLSAKLDLNRGRYDDALGKFRAAEAAPLIRGDAMEGEGLSLALAGRQAEATTVLKKTVAEYPKAWRAWNALGGAYDESRQWDQADDAYAHALAASDAPAIVLNNRGYSHLLRNQLDEASTDFVEALRQRPDLDAARTNLRLAMALKGEYARATAGAQKDSEAAVLNNAGFAALVRGDYARAETLLQQAIQRKGEYYDLATANLELVREGKARAATESHDSK